jgi:hypothetical protein
MAPPKNMEPFLLNRSYRLLQEVRRKEVDLSGTSSLPLNTPFFSPFFWVPGLSMIR